MQTINQAANKGTMFPGVAIHYRADALLQESQNAIYLRTDRMFARLMLWQWLAGIAAALWISPQTWMGAAGEGPAQVWAAIFFGGAIAGLPLFLIWKHPGRALTRHVIAAAQMLFSALFIHLTGGRIETHFHIFGSLAILAFYRDWRVLVTATAVMAADHFARGAFWPQSIFGVMTVSPWRWLEHAGWVVFEDTFLFIFIRQSLADMREVATRRAKLETMSTVIESRVDERTGELAAAKNEAALASVRFQFIFGSVPVGITWMTRGEPATRMVNAAFARITGVPIEHCRQVELYRLATHPEDRGKQDALHAELEAGKIDHYTIEKRYVHEDGTICWTALTVHFFHDSVSGKIQEISTLVDLTQHKQAEEALAQTSSLMDTLLANSPDAIYFKDLQSRFVCYSQVLLKYFKFSNPDALKGKTDFDCYLEDVARPYYEAEQEIIRTGQPVIGHLEKGIDVNGRTFWGLTSKLPWRDLHGNIIGTFGVSKDVTLLKVVEEKLAYERDLLSALMDHIPDRIYFKDCASRFVRCSQEVARVLERDQAEIIGKTDFDFYPEEFAAKTRQEEQEIIRTNQPRVGYVETRVLADGRQTWSLTTKMPWRNPAGETIGIMGISKDITNIKETEMKLEKVHKELLEASRRAGMSEVATSVLHNVGNVLNSVNVSATLVADQVRALKVANLAKVNALLQAHEADLAHFLANDPQGKQIRGYLSTLAEHLTGAQGSILKELESLRKNMEHMKEIVSMQQSYSKVYGIAETMPVVDLIEDAIRMNAGAFVRHDVALTRDYQTQPTVTLEKHKVLQILVNIMRNAKYACDESGREDKKMKISVSNGNNRVKIAVVDNGVGIAKENLTRIFAHGFTTRKDGHGYGLHSGALAANDLGGSLTAHSDGPGLGATFVLEVPLKQEGIHHE